jgi:hypothetical protein
MVESSVELESGDELTISSISDRSTSCGGNASNDWDSLFVAS